MASDECLYKTGSVYVYLIDLTKDMDIHKKIWRKFVFMFIMYVILYFIYSHTYLHAVLANIWQVNMLMKSTSHFLADQHSANIDFLCVSSVLFVGRLMSILQNTNTHVYNIRKFLEAFFCSAINKENLNKTEIIIVIIIVRALSPMLGIARSFSNQVYIRFVIQSMKRNNNHTRRMCAVMYVHFDNLICDFKQTIIQNERTNTFILTRWEKVGIVDNVNEAMRTNVAHWTLNNTFKRIESLADYDKTSTNSSG